MTSSTGNFAELLWPGIAEIFGNTYNDYPTLYTEIFTQKRSNKAFEKEQGVTGLGLASVKDQSNAINYQDPYQGFQKEYVNVTYGIGSSVTREMYEDDLYNYINSLPGMLARSMRQTEETLGFNHLNNAFDTSYTGADGSSLIAGGGSGNTAHARVGGGTFRNELATDSDLTQTSLEQALQDMADSSVMAVDDQGLVIRIMPKVLVVHPQNQLRARKILESSGVTGSANNDKNPIPGILSKVVVSPYLADTEAWFIITDVPNGLTWYNRRGTQFGRDNEFDTENLKFKATARWSSGWTDPRGIFGTQGA